jgi:hypothetical protein
MPKSGYSEKTIEGLFIRSYWGWLPQAESMKCIDVYRFTITHGWCYGEWSVSSDGCYDLIDGEGQLLEFCLTNGQE